MCFVTELAVIPEAPETGALALQRDEFFEGGLLTPELVTQIEKQVVLVKRMRLAVCQLTEPSHWMDFGGKPYLLSGGIHTIASTIGVEFGPPEVARDEGQDDKGSFCRFVVRLCGMWRGRKIHEIGSASSRDDLYKGKPLGDIIGDLEKKALTNAQHRVLDKITGIGGVTWDLLATIKIHRGGGGAIRFKGTEQRATTGAGGWTPAKEKLWGYLCDLCNGDPEQAADELFRITNNPGKGFPGIRDPKALSDRSVEYHLPRLEAAWKKQFETLPEVGGPAAAAQERAPGQEG